MNHRPPLWADRFLEWFCNPDLLEDLQGDLHEIYFNKIDTGNRWAGAYFSWMVLRSFRPSVIKRNSTFNNYGLMMFSNNLKIAFRVFNRDRFNSFINLTGLAIGITCFLLIGFYVKQELSFDRFHSKNDRIYRTWLKEDYGEGKVFFNSVTPLIFESTLEDNFEQIETVVQFNVRNYLVGEGEDRINEGVAIVSPEFFHVFDFPVVEGSKTIPISDRNSIALSESYAKKYFGDQNSPVGQVLPIQIGEEIREFRVSGVFKDMPRESSIQFDMAISNENNLAIYGERSMNAWWTVSQETYVLLKEGATIESVEESIPDVVMNYLEGRVNPGEYNIGFQPLTDIHLNQDIPVGIAPVGNPAYVFVLGTISLLVLIIACINYTTLSIGQSLKRVKEVGVRKVMGAMKGSLINQYLSQSILVAFFALLIGLGAAYLIEPWFNKITGANVDLTFQPWHIGLYALLIIIIGTISGIYPSFILSGLDATSILKGRSQPRSNYRVRKGMVIFQFIITVFLISSTLIMNRQLNYVQSKDLGYDYHATVSVPLYPNPSSQGLGEFVGSAMEKGEILRERLLQYPQIKDVGMGSHVFGTPGWGNLAFTDDSETFRRFRLLVVDPYYFETFNIDTKLGRPFDPKNEVDRKQSVILNEAAVAYFGLEDPLNERLPNREFGEHSIIGVTEDFNYSSLHYAVEPLVITENLDIIFSGVSDVGFGDSPIPKIVFKYSGDNLLQVKDILSREWPNVYEDEELSFSFVEEDMKVLYAEEEQLSRLILVATTLSIVIASLGLLGLTVLVINSSVKEIGIRKVNGASTYSIFKLLAGKFSMQLVFGIVISIPITVWIMNQWLKEFEYHINIGPGSFVLSAVLSVLIALVVISYHTIRAARVNPVKSLHTE